MPVDIQFEPGDLCVLCISGVLTHAEFAKAQETLAPKIDAGAHPRLLVILINFEGWEAGGNWSDLGFLLSQGSKIQKIAITGDPRREAEALMFAGKASGPPASDSSPRSGCPRREHGSPNDASAPAATASCSFPDATLHLFHRTHLRTSRLRERANLHLAPGGGLSGSYHQ